jgi:membrane protease YdiL (CAAX protease family)
MTISLRWLECTTLSLLLPLALWYVGDARLAFLALMAIAVLAVWWLWRQEGFRFRQEWNAAALTSRYLKRSLLLAAGCMALLSLALWWYQPVLLFRFVREQPHIFLLVVVAYPLWSVIPQELVYRTFWFRRYGTLWPHHWHLLSANALSFGLGHLVFANPIAPLLSTAGGLLFALRYHHTRSLAVAVLEHTIYGLMLFAVGWGIYFYHGGAAVLAAMPSS